MPLLVLDSTFYKNDFEEIKIAYLFKHQIVNTKVYTSILNVLIYLISPATFLC